MKAIVLVPFRAKHDHKVTYAPGEVKEFDNDRAVALAARGLVKPLEEAPIDKGNDSATPTPAKNGGLKVTGKGKSSKKDKENPIEAEAPTSESEDANPTPDDAQAADVNAESETESETENDSKDNE